MPSRVTSSSCAAIVGSNEREFCTAAEVFSPEKQKAAPYVFLQLIAMHRAPHQVGDELLACCQSDTDFSSSGESKLSPASAGPFFRSACWCVRDHSFACRSIVRNKQIKGELQRHTICAFRSIRYVYVF
jgi:hypothetical protein